MGIGFNAGLYVNTGPYASPTWLEVTVVGACNLDSSYNEAEAGTRESRVVLAETGRVVLGVSGQIRVQHDNAAYEILRDAHVQDEPVDVMALNGKSNVNGSHGSRFWGKVFAFGEDQSLDNVIFKDFTIKPIPPAIEAQKAKAVMVTGGAPVYSDIGVTDGS